jgi:hypothetical protein
MAMGSHSHSVVATANHRANVGVVVIGVEVSPMTTAITRNTIGHTKKVMSVKNGKHFFNYFVF